MAISSGYDPFFTNQLTEEASRAILMRVQIRDYRAREQICMAGTPADAIYFVAAGAVQCGEVVLTPGEHFGEVEVLRNAPHTATAFAIGDVQLWILYKYDLEALLADQKNAAFNLALSRHIAEKLIVQQHQVVGFRPSRFLRSTPERSGGAKISKVVGQPHAPFVASRRNLPIWLGLAGLVFFFGGVVLVGLALAFTATSINVGGLMLNAPEVAPTESRRVRVGPPKVGFFVNPNEINPAPVESTQTKPIATEAHIVSAGDTLSGIAQTHGTTLAVLRALNNLNSDVIRVGVQLSVPQGIEMPRVAIALPTRAAPNPGLRPPPTFTPLAAKPTLTQIPVSLPAMAAPIAATSPPRTWEMPAWTSVEDAKVAPGQKYWRLVKAIYFDEASAGGRINILVAALSEDGKPLLDIPVRMEWGANEYTMRKTEDKRDPFLLPYNLDIIAAHDMAGGSSFAPDRGERGGYKITVEGLPSDAVGGMGLPLKRHVAFLLVFQRTTR